MVSFKQLLALAPLAAALAPSALAAVVPIDLDALILEGALATVTPDDDGAFTIDGSDCMGSMDDDADAGAGALSLADLLPHHLSASLDTTATGRAFQPLPVIDIDITTAGVALRLPPGAVCAGGGTKNLCLVHVLGPRGGATLAVVVDQQPGNAVEIDVIEVPDPEPEPLTLIVPFNEEPAPEISAVVVERPALPAPAAVAPAAASASTTPEVVRLAEPVPKLVPGEKTKPSVLQFLKTLVPAARHHASL